MTSSKKKEANPTEKKLSPKETMISRIEQLPPGQNRIYKLPQNYWDGLGGFIIVEPNPRYPGKKQRKYIVSVDKIADGKPAGKKARVFDSDKPKEIADWILDKRAATPEEETSLPSSNSSAKADKRGYSQPVGHLFRWSGLLALVVVLLLAAWSGQIVITILAGLVLSAAGLAKLWSWCSLAGVRCQRILSETRAFPGEDIELKLRLVNRKPLPLPWVQVDDEIPYGLSVTDAPLTPGSRPGASALNNIASVLWYTGVSWRYRLHCTKRGYYSLGPLMVTSGDIFGFYPRSIAQPVTDNVVVYPKLYPLANLSMPSLFPIGETKAQRRIFEDTTRPIGVRDYRPGDSLRYVHWKASARHQNLQVKVFEPTTTLKVILFLAVDSFQDYRMSPEDDFELGISAAASIANYVVEQRSPVGLFANTLLPDSSQPVRILPSSGPGQLVNILEALAKVILSPTEPFEEFLQGEQSSLPWGATVVIILARPSELLPELVDNLSRAGHKPVVLHIGERQDDGIDHRVAWYNIKNPDDLIELSLKEIK